MYKIQQSDNSVVSGKKWCPVIDAVLYRIRIFEIPADFGLHVATGYASCSLQSEWTLQFTYTRGGEYIIGRLVIEWVLAEAVIPWR